MTLRPLKPSSRHVEEPTRWSGKDTLISSAAIVGSLAGTALVGPAALSVAPAVIAWRVMRVNSRNRALATMAAHHAHNEGEAARQSIAARPLVADALRKTAAAENDKKAAQTSEAAALAERDTANADRDAALKEAQKAKQDLIDLGPDAILNDIANAAGIRIKSGTDLPGMRDAIIKELDSRNLKIASLDGLFVKAQAEITDLQNQLRMAATARPTGAASKGSVPQADFDQIQDALAEANDALDAARNDLAMAQATIATLNTEINALKNNGGGSATSLKELADAVQALKDAEKKVDKTKNRIGKMTNDVLARLLGVMEKLKDSGVEVKVLGLISNHLDSLTSKLASDPKSI